MAKCSCKISQCIVIQFSCIHVSHASQRGSSANCKSLTMPWHHYFHNPWLHMTHARPSCEHLLAIPYVVRSRSSCSVIILGSGASYLASCSQTAMYLISCVLNQLFLNQLQHVFWGKLEWAHTTVLSSGWLFCCTIRSYIYILYNTILLQFISWYCIIVIVVLSVHMGMTEWQRQNVWSVGHSMCNEWRKLNRGEVLRKGKWGFTSKESPTNSGKTLKPKTNEKLGFTGKES